MLCRESRSFFCFEMTGGQKYLSGLSNEVPAIRKVPTKAHASRNRVNSASLATTVSCKAVQGSIHSLDENTKDDAERRAKQSTQER